MVGAAGYQLAPTVWLDAGIFFSHLGLEGWISRDNLSYTRSPVADFSPYYEAGAKVTFAASPKLTAMFVLINGWQDVSNYNTPRAGGVRLDYAPTKTVTLTYDNFIGNAAADSAPVRMRALSFVGRVEQYSDPSQVIVVTGLPASFQTTAASVGADVKPQAPVLWRTELRGFRSKDAVWPTHTAGGLSTNDAFFVSSLALTF